MIEYVDHNDFQANAARSEKGELEVIALLDRKFKHIRMHPKTNKTKEYDIKGWINDKTEVKFEVKEDFRCFGVFEHITGDGPTGNIPVEDQSRGKSSGLKTSEADHWIFRVNLSQSEVKHYMIPLKDLKELVEKRMFRRSFKQPHTDSGNYTYMFRYETLIKHCLCIDDLKDTK